MKFFYQLFLNLFFFALYFIAGFKIIEATSFGSIMQDENSLSWNKFLIVIIFFMIISFASIGTTYSVLARSQNKIKKGIMLDDKDVEVNPDVVIDGKEDSPDNLMDIIEDKTGKIFTEPVKSKKKKKK